MAAEQGLSVDEDGLPRADGRAARRAPRPTPVRRRASTPTPTVYRETLDAYGPTDWLAYTTLDTESRVLGAARAAAQSVPALAEGEVGEVVLDRTAVLRRVRRPERRRRRPRAGTAVAPRCSTSSARSAGLVVHQVRVARGRADRRARRCHAEVDPEWRLGARQAHSGTHVVHAALREVLGPTALQSGSYNRPGYLRLDFGWSGALDARAAPRRRAGLEPGAARRPPGLAART